MTDDYDPAYRKGADSAYARSQRRRKTQKATPENRFNSQSQQDYSKSSDSKEIQLLEAIQQLSLLKNKTVIDSEKPSLENRITFLEKKIENQLPHFPKNSAPYIAYNKIR